MSRVPLSNLNLFIVKTKHDNGLDTSVSSRCLLQVYSLLFLAKYGESQTHKKWIHKKKKIHIDELQVSLTCIKLLTSSIPYITTKQLNEDDIMDNNNSSKCATDSVT